MAELETFDPGDGGKKGKKGKKGTVNGKKVETAPDGTKYAVKDGKKIAISKPTSVSTLEKKTTMQMKPKEGIRTSVTGAKDPDQAERYGEMKTPSGDKVANYRTPEGKEYFKQEGKKVFTKPSTAMGGEKPQPPKENTMSSVSRKPEFDQYKSEKTEETMKTPSGDRVNLYRTKTGQEYIVRDGKKVVLKTSPTMTRL
jgi:hypothetical protein